MRIKDKNQKIETLQNLSKYQKFHCVEVENSSGTVVRFAVEGNDTVFVYCKGLRRYGCRYSIPQFTELYDLIIDSEEELDKKWHKRIARAIKCLEKSGLWSEQKVFFENLYKMTLEDKNALDAIYWSDLNKYNSSNDDLDKLQKAYEPFIEKYPFAFSKTDDGIYTLITDYIWERSNCKLKSMYFGKGQNAFIKKVIKKTIQDKQDYRFGTRVNYDVSFEYNSDKNMAWYSEEYKDCGNGHYYIALDENTALFCEDD